MNVTDTSEPIHSHALFRISFAMFLAYLTIGIPLVTLPLFVHQQLQFNDVLVGIAVGSQFIATLVTRGVAGRKADILGGRRTVCLGLVCCGASGALMLGSSFALANPLVCYLLLIIGRMVLGLGESLILTGNLTWGMWLAGAPRAGKVIAWNGMATYGALAAGGPLGLALYHHSGLPMMALITLVLPLGAWCVMNGIPENVPGKRMRAPVRHVISLIWRPGVGLVLQGIGFASLSAFAVLYFTERQWNYAGFAMTLFGCAFIVTRLFFGHMPDRYGGVRIATLSLLTESVGLLLLWSAPIPAIALAGAALTGCGCSLMFPSLGVEVVRRVPDEIRGTALGIWSAFQDLAYGLTAPLAGLITPLMGYRQVFLIAAACALLGAASLTHLLRQR